MSIEDVSNLLRSFWGLWLMIVFTGIVAWAYWPRNKEHFEAYADMPLWDDDKHKERS